MGASADYKQIAIASLTEQRNVVVSKCSLGGYTIAQQLVVDEGGKSIGVFLKGAFHIANVEGIKNLRDVLNYVLQQETEAEQLEMGD